MGETEIAREREREKEMTHSNDRIEHVTRFESRIDRIFFLFRIARIIFLSLIDHYGFKFHRA